MSGDHELKVPLRLNEMNPAQAGQLLTANPRLLLPVGTMVVRSAQVPIGADTIIVDRIADELSARVRIARAPIIPFGVHARSDPDAPGSASITRKTLHRMMNELIAAWETEAGVRDFIILTGHTADAHLEALSTIRSKFSVRLLTIFQVPQLSDPQDTEPVEIPLIAFLAPTLIAHVPTETRDRGEAMYWRIVDSLARELTHVAD